MKELGRQEAPTGRFSTSNGSVGATHAVIQPMGGDILQGTVSPTPEQTVSQISCKQELSEPPSSQFFQMIQKTDLGSGGLPRQGSLLASVSLDRN